MLKSKYKDFESTSNFRPARNISLSINPTISLKVKKASKACIMPHFNFEPAI